MKDRLNDAGELDGQQTHRPPLLTPEGLVGRWAEQDATGRRPTEGGSRHRKDVKFTASKARDELRCCDDGDDDKESDLSVVLCGVRGPSNVGSAMRLCSCFGTSSLLHVHYAADDRTNARYWTQPPLLKALRSSAVGTDRRFGRRPTGDGSRPRRRESDSDNDDRRDATTTATTATEMPFRSVGVDEYVSSLSDSSARRRRPVVVLEALAGAESIHDFAFPRQCSILVGSENRGVDRRVLGALREGFDAAVYVPMTGPHHSMNVATALAVALYEYRRQWPGGDE